MKHFGLVCPATTGHLNTILPLGKELRNRGHQFTLFGKLDAEKAVTNAGLGYVAIGEAEFPIGSMANALKNLGQFQGRAALAFTVQLFNENASVFLRDCPGVGSRVKWSGCDESIPVKAVSVAKLRDAISQVLREPSYRENACRLQAAIQRCGGVTQAADIVELAASTNQPVRRVPDLSPASPPNSTAEGPLGMESH